MRVRLLPLGALALLPGEALPQVCPQGPVVLDVQPDSPVPPGAPVAISVTGTPGSLAILVRGPIAGQTTLPGPGPIGGTVLCLAPPFEGMPLAPLPPSGTLTVPVPMPTASPGTVFQFQALTLTPPVPTVDTSNTDSVAIGPPPPPPRCSVGTAQMTITPDGQVQPGDTISIAVAAAPASLVLLAMGPQPGATPLFPFPIVLCLGMPFEFHPAGVVPPSGPLVLLNQIPPNAPLPGNVTIFFHAFAISVSNGVFTIDPSNPDSLHI